MTRRSFTAATIGGSLAAALSPVASGLAAGATGSSADATVDAEAARLEGLYAAARAEGGTLTVWAGGDAPTQADWIAQAFRKRFPDVPISITVDLSKLHDARIDDALRTGGALPDVTHLQTTHDFERWKAQGVLRPYRPIGFPSFRRAYADPDGAFYPVFFFAFAPTVNPSLIPERETPRGYRDFLRPAYRDSLVLTYPHDDDAVLYVYSRIVRKYGAGYLDELARQNPTFLRGTAAPAILAERTPYTANLTGSLARHRVALPETDPFLIWPQTGATFRRSPHPAAAELYLSWLTGKEFQSTLATAWPARTDVPAPAALGTIESHRNADPQEFKRFMRDRRQVAHYQRMMAQAFGPVRGPSPLSDPLLLPIVSPGLAG